MRRDARQPGQSLLEATFGLVIITIVVIALIDLAMVIYGVSLNDTACRNAATAAAAGNAREAEDRARIAIDQSSVSHLGTIISQPTLVSPVKVELTCQPAARLDPETDHLFNPGGSVTGVVTVTTQIEIKPIAIEFVFWRGQSLVFRSSQSFPLHCTNPRS